MTITSRRKTGVGNVSHPQGQWELVIDFGKVVDWPNRFDWTGQDTTGIGRCTDYQGVRSGSGFSGVIAYFDAV